MADVPIAGRVVSFKEDFFERVVNVTWGKVVEQGLLAVNVGGTPLEAIALDSGEKFPGISSGASGLGFTVLTSGIVVFGKPKDGGACFMATTNGKTIRRGIQDTADENKIKWSTVYSNSDGIAALSFAGDAFFIAFYDASGNPAHVVSFDGTSFQNAGFPYAGVPPHIDGENHYALSPGAVANNGEGVYAAVGIFGQDDTYPQIITATNNMMWGHSNTGQSWHSGYSYPETANPGTRPNSFLQMYTNVAGGAGRFVAVATRNDVFPRYVPGVDDTAQDIHPTASAAVSSNGNSWSTVPLPGAVVADAVPDPRGGHYPSNESVGACVAFIKTGKNEGYFVITANGFIGAPYGSTDSSSNSQCWRGDGFNWSMIMSRSDPYLSTVSAIAKDLSKTKIVRI